MNEPKIDDKYASELHTLLGEEYVARITRGKCKECGCGPATVQELESMRKYVLDNGVTAIARPGTPIHALVDHMPFELPAADEVVQRKQA